MTENRSGAHLAGKNLREEHFQYDPGGDWGLLADQLPAGLFILSGGLQDVQVNPWLAGRLGVPGRSSLSRQEFWNRLEDLSLLPDQTHRALKAGLKNLDGDHRDVRIELQVRSGEHWLLELASVQGEKGGPDRWAGWVLDRTPEMDYFRDQVDLLAEICTRARIGAAAASGNLGALAGNLPGWDSEVVADFVEVAGDHVLRIQQSLDLALSYSSLIKGVPLYEEAVAVADLLEEIRRSGSLGGIRLELAAGEKAGELRAQIDPALTRLALETILNELMQHNPPGKQVDALLETADGYLVLKLASPRTLPLPGLDAERQPLWSDNGSARLFLTRQLLAAQGAQIGIEDRPAQDGGGVDIRIQLPLADEARDDLESVVLAAGEGDRQGRILLAEDQPDYQLRLRNALSEQGYRVDLAGDGSAALDMVQTAKPDLVILARNLPGMDGLLVTQGIRRWSDVPIIMISGRLNPDEKLYAYRLGVDDYLRKPFLIEELLAKAAVFISRGKAQLGERGPEIYQSGGVRINHTLRQVWIRGEEVELTPIEYNLLAYMARHGRQIITYEQLQESVWEGPEKGSRQGLFVHVRRLREKIESDPEEPKIIRNKWGVGYVFTP